MDVCLLCLYVVLSCVGRGLCDGLITHPEESYRVCLYTCDQETPKREAKSPSWTISACEWTNAWMIVWHTVYNNFHGELIRPKTPYHEATPNSTEHPEYLFLHRVWFQSVIFVCGKGPLTSVTFKCEFILTNTYRFPLEHDVEFKSNFQNITLFS
jgi:hypothetical protein